MIKMRIWPIMCSLTFFLLLIPIYILLNQSLVILSKLKAETSNCTKCLQRSQTPRYCGGELKCNQIWRKDHDLEYLLSQEASGHLGRQPEEISVRIKDQDVNYVSSQKAPIYHKSQSNYVRIWKTDQYVESTHSEKASGNSEIQDQDLDINLEPLKYIENQLKYMGDRIQDQDQNLDWAPNHEASMHLSRQLDDVRKRIQEAKRKIGELVEATEEAGDKMEAAYREERGWYCLWFILHHKLCHHPDSPQYPLQHDQYK